jgi:hypothetical protein
MDWKNRIVGLEYHTARELMDNSGNWRTHPKHQADALQGVLQEVGVVDALLIYKSERQGGLTIIDGHLRKELDADAVWPCLRTDLNDEEADLILATFDWLTYQAQADQEQLNTLLEQAKTENQAVQQLLEDLSRNFDLSVSDVEFPEYTEDIENEVKYITCPECGHQWPK